MDFLGVMWEGEGGLLWGLVGGRRYKGFGNKLRM